MNGIIQVAKSLFCLNLHTIANKIGLQVFKGILTILTRIFTVTKNQLKTAKSLIKPPSMDFSHLSAFCL